MKLKAITGMILSLFLASMLTVTFTIAPTAGSENGLVGYWKFDEGSGPTASDSSGYNNYGTVYGATWTDGKVGKALSFDGINDYVRIPDSDSLDITEDLTIAAWVKTSQTGRPSDIFCNLRQVSPHDGYALEITSTGNVRFYSQEKDLVSKGKINTGTWKYVVVVLSGTTATIYIDGAFDNSGTVNVPNANDLDQTIAASYTPYYFFNGVIDEVRVYNRALSQSEILPNKYTIVFVPLNWQGDLSSFYTEANSQASFLIDNVGELTPDNTELIDVAKNLVLSFDKNENGWLTFNRWADISQFANDNGATGDRYVAITNENIWGSVAGLSIWGPVVVVEAGVGMGSVTAHELGHSWGLLDEYNPDYWQSERNYRYPASIPPNSYPGNDPELVTQPVVKSYGRPFDTKRCIMGSAGNDIYGTPIVRGYCPAHTQDGTNYVGCYAYVDNVISNEWSQPSSGLVKTVITFYKNGTSPKVEEIRGVSMMGRPMECFRPQNYSLQVYSERGNLIYDSNITASFWLLPSQLLNGTAHPIETDTVTVHWLAPMFSETTVTVNLKDNVADQVIATQIVTIVERPVGVGGIVVPVDKFVLLAPYIGLTTSMAIAAVVTAVYVKRVKRRR